MHSAWSGRQPGYPRGASPLASTEAGRIPPYADDVVRPAPRSKQKSAYQPIPSSPQKNGPPKGPEGRGSLNPRFRFGGLFVYQVRFRLPVIHPAPTVGNYALDHIAVFVQAEV